jgi:hypothetical protein
MSVFENDEIDQQRKEAEGWLAGQKPITCPCCSSTHFDFRGYARVQLLAPGTPVSVSVWRCVACPYVALLEKELPAEA